ncbi:hypothetical protein HN011_000457 [Eciton burchellii]|nr:hypothetical protein HN011_000457 [Eciton burchellii]
MTKFRKTDAVKTRAMARDTASDRGAKKINRNETRFPTQMILCFSSPNEADDDDDDDDDHDDDDDYSERQGTGHDSAQSRNANDNRRSARSHVDFLSYVLKKRRTACAHADSDAEEDRSYQLERRELITRARFDRNRTARGDDSA